MTQAVCIRANRDSAENIVQYTLKINNKTFDIEKNKLKRLIQSGQISVSNIKLQSNNRIYIQSINQNNNQKLIVYHGQPNKSVIPVYGAGEDKHDYGRGFYTTPYKELACEWAAWMGNKRGYVHTYEIDIQNLKILDFDQQGVLSWLAELMQHRDADNQINYKKKQPLFIQRYKLDTSQYDIIRGWRADSSYFYIAKHFVRNNIDFQILEEMLKCGDLKEQICIKQQKAFNNIKLVSTDEIDTIKYKQLYDARDTAAREKMHSLMLSDKNTLTNTFDTIMQRGRNDGV